MVINITAFWSMWSILREIFYSQEIVVKFMWPKHENYQCKMENKFVSGLSTDCPMCLIDGQNVKN